MNKDEYEASRQEYGKRYVEKLERQKEQIEDDLESFDFSKHNPEALKYVNRQLAHARRKNIIFEAKDKLGSGVVWLVFIFTVLIFASGVWNTINKEQSTPPKQVAQVQSKSVESILLNNAEEQKKQLDLVKGRQQDWLNNLKQSESYKRNEELAKKLATGKCSYKTTKQGDFYVCEFNAND